MRRLTIGCLPGSRSSSATRPWLFLRARSSGPPDGARHFAGELPPLADSWAWAHAQVMGPTGRRREGSKVADRLSVEHGPENLSRLFCPRKLDATGARSRVWCRPSIAGKRRGWSLGGGTLEPAWTREAGVTMPAAKSCCRCSTVELLDAPAGDFEELAGGSRGLLAPWKSGGVRGCESRSARNGPAKARRRAAGRVQVLRCALVSPTPMPERSAAGGERNWDALARELLRAEIDRANANSEDDLPRVGPRLYAKFQRGAAASARCSGTRLIETAAADRDWFPQLNTSPMPRIVAGLGTRVVQKDQEPLMQAAWAQVGEIAAANRVLARAQFGRYVGGALHRSHLSKLDAGVLSQVLRGVQGKIRAEGSARTVYGEVRASWVAPAAMTAAFRRATRARGPLARFASGAGAVALRQLVAVDGSFRDFRRLYVEPEGVRTLSSSAIAAIPRALLADKLGVSEANAPRVLEEMLAARTSGISVADRLARPLASWPVREGTLDLGQRAAAQITERVQAALPSRFSASPGRAEALTPLLVGIGNTSVPEVAARSKATINRIGRRLPFSPVPSSVGLPLRLGAIQPLRTFSASVAPHAEAVAAAATELPARFRFETDVSRQVTAAITSSHAIPNRAVAAAVSQIVLGTGVAGLTKTPERPQLDFTRAMLLTTVAPATTVTAYAYSRLRNPPSWLAPDSFKDGRITPIMAAPRFDRAMFAALNDYDRDWLIPGLDKIELTDFVTTLKTNPQFTETFLIGLSDEMSRELLWRGYPTDQRGTYFYRFWNEDRDESRSQSIVSTRRHSALIWSVAAMSASSWWCEARSCVAIRTRSCSPRTRKRQTKRGSRSLLLQTRLRRLWRRFFSIIISRRISCSSASIFRRIGCETSRGGSSSRRIRARPLLAST